MTLTAPTGRPGTAAVVTGQARYALTDYWRARVVAVLSFLLPLTWLVMIGAMAGNDVLDESSGLRVMQFATPGALTMGVLYATLPTMAITVAEARQSGVLKRLRGTPLPMWAYLVGRAIGASVFALAAVLTALAVAVVAFDVQVVWRTLPATLATLVVAVVCFVAVGLAVSVLAPTTVVAQAVSIGGVVVLSFISGLFTVGGTLPEPVTRVADLFPVKPLVEALQDQFNPYLTGGQWDLRALGVMLVWVVAGAAIAVRGLRARETTGTRAGRAAGEPVLGSRVPPSGPVSAPSPDDDVPAWRAGPLTAASVGRPGALALLGAQVATAVRATWRDPGAVFFAVLMPVGLFALISATVPDDATVDGLAVPVHLAAGMIAWGVAVTSFTNIPESVVQARDRGVLKRLRGTPLPALHYLAGRVVAGILIGAVVAVLVLGLAALAYDVEPRGLLAAFGLVVLGSLTMTACGFLLAALVPTARAYGAVALLVLLPMAFVSDVFTVGAPGWLRTIGSFLPLKHLQNALADVLGGLAGVDTWWHVALLGAWALGTGVLAVRLFRWNVTD